MTFCPLALLSWGPSRDQRIPGSRGHTLLCTAWSGVHGTVGLQQRHPPCHRPHRVRDPLASTPWGTPSSGDVWSFGLPHSRPATPPLPHPLGKCELRGAEGRCPKQAGRWTSCFTFSHGCAMSLEPGPAGHIFGGNGNQLTGFSMKADQGDQTSRVKGVEFNQIWRVIRYQGWVVLARLI